MGDTDAPFGMKEKCRNFEGFNSYEKFPYVAVRNKGMPPKNSLEIPMERASIGILEENFAPRIPVFFLYGIQTPLLELPCILSSYRNPEGMTLNLCVFHFLHSKWGLRSMDGGDIPVSIPM